ncbi:hypothetical protein GCM10022223_61190 [Kineosporia mesophila]|uniref:Ricin B lectin domain-containing protein n=1 Tax=Kineosporia mesophila TaxID=566012 RepID=A0ABP7AL19_9ACTN
MLLSAGFVTVASPASAATVLGTSTIVNVNYTNDCLSSNFAGSVYATPCSGSEYHRWQKMSNGELRNVGTGLCLSANADDVYTVACSDARTHVWLHHLVTGTANSYYLGNNYYNTMELSMNDANDVYLAGGNNILAHMWYTNF